MSTIEPTLSPPFAPQDSVMRTIWGSADLIMLVFAGSAAEFALNRAVDWLFFTGGVPRDPIARLFSTARFAQAIAFSDEATALATFDRINRIHAGVERARAATIPDWAHRDVLYMLIDYSERAYGLMHRPLTPAEQHDMYALFRRVGTGLGVRALPDDYVAWRADRERHLDADLAFSDYTNMLYAQYRRHLGAGRMRLLMQIQGLLCPPQVRSLLKLGAAPPLRRVLWTYPLAQRFGLMPIIQRLLIEPRYLGDIRKLEHPDARRSPLVSARA